MDKLESLRAFAKVVELGSFSEAGRALRLSRSAVSKYIGELEDALGVQLLSRTDAPGQSDRERARPISSGCSASSASSRRQTRPCSQLQATPRGLLRVNAPMSFGTLQLGPAIAEFMQLYPELRIQLVLSDENVDPLQDGLDVTLRIAGSGILQPDRAKDHADRPRGLRFAGLLCGTRRRRRTPMICATTTASLTDFSPPATSGSCRARTAITGSSRHGRCASTMPRCCATPRWRGGGSR